MPAQVTNIWLLLSASVIGIVGAVGMALYEKYRQKEEHLQLRKSILHLGNEMQMLQKELELIKQSRQKRRNRSERKFCSSSSTSSSYYTGNDEESSDLEFYDLSEDEFEDENIKTMAFQRIDSILKDGNSENLKEILVELIEMAKETPNDVNVVCCIARTCYKLAMDAVDQDKKKQYILKGATYCETALEQIENSSKLHKWYAILLGLRAEIQPLKDRIADGHLFKEHLDKALELDPDDYELQHMLGRFAFEIANIKWYERTAAAALFQEPPKATFEEALLSFLKAENCLEEWKENKLFIAKCYLAMGNNTKAVEWLLHAKAVKIKDNKDENFNQEIVKMLKKLK